jgi:hypothetical protein
LQDAFINRAQRFFFACVLLFDILHRGCQVFFGRIFITAFALRALGKPPCAVRTELMLRFQPLAALSLGFRACFLDQGDPFVEGAPCFVS